MTPPADTDRLPMPPSNPAAAADRIELIRPDDWHVHLRDGEMLARVVGDTARQFARAIVMPNLLPPVTSTEQAAAYRGRILACVPEGLRFEPLMTLYLTEATPADEIIRASDSGFVHAVKYYPAGATTNSQSGVRELSRCRAVFEAMQRHGLPLLLHGEVTDGDIDIFDREAVFIERQLVPLLRDFPELRVVLEHITTRQAAEFIASAPDNVAATITAHHLLLNRNALLVGGVHPHHYCLPVLKRETHRQALVAAATGGSPKFFLGTDSAPHRRHSKETACGCAGIYTAAHALECYAEVFDAAGALDRLEAFASLHGPAFYRLPVNRDRIVLERAEVTVPALLGEGDEAVVPFRAGATVGWRVLPGGSG
jgi:dihydroorotase